MSYIHKQTDTGTWSVDLSLLPELAFLDHLPGVFPACRRSDSMGAETGSHILITQTTKARS